MADQSIPAVKTALATETERALAASDRIFWLVKDLKKGMMRRHLALEVNADVLETYRAAFPGCPWERVKLEDIVAPDGISAGPPDESAYAGPVSPEGIPVIATGNIRKLRFAPGGSLHVSKNFISHNANCAARGGDIILRHDGTDRGASAIIPFVNEDCALGPHVARIRTDVNRCEVFYVLNVLHFYYNSGIMKDILGEPVDRSLREVLIPLPPLDRQKAIAHSMLQLSVGMVAQEHFRDEMQEFAAILETV